MMEGRAYMRVEIYSIQNQLSVLTAIIELLPRTGLKSLTINMTFTIVVVVVITLSYLCILFTGFHIHRQMLFKWWSIIILSFDTQ